jgi:tetratricopeptide (TPR) repeat protein
MKPSIRGVLVALALVASAAAGAKEALPESYEKGLDLIHAFSGAGDELERATAIAASLAESHPDKGYGQALMAELLSTWHLQQDGTPSSVYGQIMALADEALRLNPGLAQAHVARARAMLRALKYADANKAIGSALEIDPNLVGAMFVRAEVMRRTGQESEAETWYLKFIQATTSRTRKSNAYYWMARMYQDAAWRQPNRWPALIPKARAAYQKMIDLDPGGAWKNVNFAIFLNHEVGDFDAAERYAAQALKAMEFRMARNHLAIARYQKIGATMAAMDDQALRAALEAVHSSTGVSFEHAVQFAESYTGIRGRLSRIEARLARKGT